MLEVLLESRHVKPPAPVVGAGVSAFAHVAIVMVIAIASRNIVDDWRETSREVLQYLLPPDRAPKPEQRPVRFFDWGAGEAPYASTTADLKYRVHAPTSRVGLAGDLHASDGEQAVASVTEELPENTYSVVDVDTAVFRYEDSAAPAYPASMIARNVTGFARMQFIVDSSGVIDMSTVKVLASTHPEFVSAVRDAMPRMRFHPAKIGPRAVGQLAEQQFLFKLNPPEKVGARRP